MLYALVDYSNKKRIFGGCLAEEILGEVKISVPKTNNESKLSRILLKNFEKWFSNLSSDSQKLVFNNIIAKISTKETEEPEPELPF